MNHKCTECHKEIEQPTKNQLSTWHRTGKGRIYCSKACSSEFARRSSSKVMAETNRKFASKRMKLNNPMSKKESREKMRATLRAIDHKPSVRCGNGTGPTKAEQLLANTTGLELNIVVPTKMGKYSGYPSHYKIDLGDRKERLAVEVDGNSHCSLERQAQDRKKEEFLRSIGWTVLRFNNEEVFNNTIACVDKIYAHTAFLPTESTRNF